MRVTWRTRISRKAEWRTKVPSSKQRDGDTNNYNSYGTHQNGLLPGSREVILARMQQRFNNILETEDGRGLINDAMELASTVYTEEGFFNMITKFYHIAKNLATSLMEKFCVFVFCIAALITFIVYFHYVPESIFAQWVTRLYKMLADRLFIIVCRTISEKIGEFFAGNSLVLLADEDSVPAVNDQWVTSLLNRLTAEANSLRLPAVAAN